MIVAIFASRARCLMTSIPFRCFRSLRFFIIFTDSKTNSPVEEIMI